MKKTVQQVAKLSGISVRTLHYYHKIGLLCPSEVSPAGYRLYDEKDLARLQQILFFRELEFPLKEIKALLECPSFLEEETLGRHRDLLLLKRQRLDRIILLLEKRMKGESGQDMSAFDQTEIEKAKEQYAKEVRERWGSTNAYQESEEKTARYTPGDWAAIQEEMDAIFSDFAALRGTDPGSEAAQTLVLAWQSHITAHYYRCSGEILAGLGAMYTGDERFLHNIDSRYGEGTARFVSAAIEHFASHPSGK